MKSFLDKTFNLKRNGTNVKTEIPAGITIFLTMAHIIVVNPAILQNAGMSFPGVLFATVLVCTLFWFLCSFLIISASRRALSGAFALLILEVGL
jgi:AGZA family xanthine/uracil permease-like MFS transporter